MMVHVVDQQGRPHCGFTNDPPSRWPDDHKCVEVEEAHYANCQACLARLREGDMQMMRF
jgi:hypothetical protein